MAARLWQLLASFAGVILWPWGRGPGGRLVPLDELDPHWLPDPPEPAPGGRRGMGVGFLCPLHRDHRVWLYFRKPLDGYGPKPLAQLYDVENADLSDEEEPFASVTVSTPGDDTKPIRPGCGAAFWVAGGACVIASG